MNHIILGLLAGAGVYLATKAREGMQPTPLYTPPSVTPVVLPMPSGVTNPVITHPPIVSPPVVVSPPSVNQHPISGVSGQVWFVVDYNHMNRIEDIIGTGPGSTWHVDNNIQLDGSKTLSIVNDPLGQMGKVLEIRYVGPHDDPSCLVNGTVPNYQTNSTGWFSYLACLDRHNAKLWLEDVPPVQTIIEEYDVLYLPLDPNIALWGPEKAKQHYWRGTRQSQVSVFWEDDRHITMSYYHDAVEAQARVPKFDRVDMKDKRWHHIKAKWKNSDPGMNNGSQELWVDGLLEAVVYNIVDHGNRWNGVHNYRQGSNNLRRFEANWIVTLG